MNCQVYRRYFGQYLDGSISSAERREVESHLDGCDDCRQQLGWERRVWDELRRLPVPPMRKGFAEHAIAAAIGQKMPSRPLRQRWVGLAVAASLLAGVAIGALVQRDAQVQTQPMVVLSQGKDTLRLVFNASKSVKGVRFTVMLPADVEMAGHPGAHEIVWRGQLKQGRNLLSLPLVVQRQGRGVLRAEVQYGHYVRKIRVGVDINGSKAVSRI